MKKKHRFVMRNLHKSDKIIRSYMRFKVIFEEGKKDKSTLKIDPIWILEERFICEIFD